MDLTIRQFIISLLGSATTPADMSITPTAGLNIQFSDSLADGTGADQANQVWWDSASLIADAEGSIDLAGSLTDIFGATITFTKIKGIIFKNTSTTASVLKLGGGTGQDGTNAWDTWICSAAGAGAGDGSEGVLVRAGGAIGFWAPDATGYAVTAGTGDILTIKERASLAATYEIAIVGVV